MKNIRNSIITKPLSIILAVLTLNLTFYSCSKEDEDTGGGNNNHYYPPMEYFDGSAIELKTDEEGRYDLNTEISSQGEVFDLTYEFQIVDQSGYPIEGITINYNQLNEKSLIYIYDEEERYASAIFIGTPQELMNYSNSKNAQIATIYNNSPFGKNNNNFKTTEGENSFIGLLITVLTIGAAEVGFFLNAYQNSEFLLTDYVSSTEDYILYCKSFDEIGELIKARTAMALNLASIFVSFVKVGTGQYSNPIELKRTLLNKPKEKIRDELLYHGIEIWATTMDDLVGRDVAIKVFPYEEDESFSRVRNLFAFFTIEYDNEVCTGDGIISGTITDAETGYEIEDVIVKLSGDDNSTDLTNSQGEYSFEGLSEGNYTIQAEKSGYITEEKYIEFDGSTAVANFVLSQTIADDEYRVVLTWGEEPEDLDVHLFTENGDHIYYADQGSLTSYPYINLDIDDISSFGPETITIAQLQASSIYVHNYTGYPDIKESDAEIRVYNGNQLIETYDIPTSGSGEWWYVFDIDNSGYITDQDYLTDMKNMNLKNKNVK
jgi:hypothetical protein